MNNISDFIKKTHPYKDSNSANRVIKAIDFAVKNKNELSNKPIDIIRQFKQRKKLNYWKNLC